MEVFHYFNEVAFFVSIAAFLLAASELSLRFGRRVAKKSKEDFSSQTANFGGALLGMLALLLGFAFAMALERFNTRKALMLEEVIDIKTAYMRADLLGKTEGAAAKRMITDYTKLRCEYYKPGTLAIEMEENVMLTEAMQDEIWQKSVALLDNPALEGSRVMHYVSALDSVFDDETKRTIARESHIPEAILWLLIVVAGISLCVNSYSLGLRGAHLLLPRFFLIVAISAVLCIILDLDRPIRGLIQIDQSEMAQLCEAMEAALADARTPKK